MPTARRGTVARERLFTALDSCAQSPLTLVAGPAGIGKTVAVASWVAAGRAPGSVAWVSLDARDDTRPRFWRLILAGLARTGEVGEAIGTRFAVASNGTVDAVLPALVGQLAELAEPIVLVLDDLDAITDPAIMGDLELLLRAPPPNLRLIATARRVPSLRLQRLRLSGAVREIDASDLVFRRDEAALLLEAAGVTLGDVEMGLLWERTEGWAAGLGLTAMALRTRTDPAAFVAQFAGDGSPVADYLLEEVLAGQPTHVRDFLLRTSIPDTICGELADVLTDRRGGGAMLAQLHQDGIMATVLDDRREWFRYHGLFRGLLRSLLRREDAAMALELHRRAATWLEGHGRAVEAAGHAVEAGAWSLLAEIVARESFALLVRGELHELAHVLREVPPVRLRENPVLPLAVAGGALELGDTQEAETWIRLADASADAVRPTDAEGYAVGRAIIGLYRGRLTGNVPSALVDAVTLMGDDDATPIAHPGMPSDLRSLALVNLGALELLTGRLDDALRDLGEGTAIASARGLAYLEVYGRGHLAVHHLWRGNVRDAEREASAALTLADAHGWRGTSRASIALGVRGVLALMRGDLDDADLCLAAAARAVARSVERPLRALVTACVARLMRAQGRPEDALRALAEVRADVADTPFWAPIRAPMAVEEAMALASLGRTGDAVELLEQELSEQGHVAGPLAVALAHVRVREGDPSAALELLRTWAGPEVGPLQLSAQVWADLVRFAAERKLGNRAEALEALDAAVARAAADDCWLPFLADWEELASSLAAYARAGGAHAAAVRTVLDRQDRVATGVRRPDPGLRAAAEQRLPRASPDELSERELAVLRYLPTTMTNREIGDELFVSVNTIKTHLKQIYRKLDTHDRRDAVARARRLGLLAPPGRS